MRLSPRVRIDAAARAIVTKGSRSSTDNVSDVTGPWTALCFSSSAGSGSDQFSRFISNVQPTFQFACAVNDWFKPVKMRTGSGSITTLGGWCFFGDDVFTGSLRFDGILLVQITRALHTRFHCFLRTPARFGGGRPRSLWRLLGGVPWVLIHDAVISSVYHSLLS